MRRRNALRLAAVAVLLLSIGVSGFAGGQKEAAAAEGRVPLRFQHWWGPDRVATIQEFFDAFNASQDELEVTLDVVSWGENVNKLLTQAAGGNLPDVTGVAQVHFGALAANGLLTPLQPYIDRTGWQSELEDFYDGVKGPFMWEGEMYCIPFDSDAGILFVNRDLFEEAGVPLPDKDSTYQDLLEMARKLTKDTDGDGKIDQYGLANTTLEDLRFINLVLLRHGEEVFNADRTRFTANTAEAAKWIQFMADLKLKHGVVPPSQSAGDLPLFLTGKVAMEFGIASSVFPTMRKIDFQLHLSPLPKGEGRNANANYVFTSGFAISRDSEHKDAAFNLLQIFGSEEALRVTAIGTEDLPGSALPPRKSMADEFMAVHSYVSGVENIFYELDNTKGYVHPGARHPKWFQTTSILNDTFQAILLGKATAREALAEAEPKVNAVLAQ